MRPVRSKLRISSIIWPGRWALSNEIWQEGKGGRGLRLAFPSILVSIAVFLEITGKLMAAKLAKIS